MKKLIHQISVIGTGQMGLGIAQVLAQCRFQVILRSRASESLEIGLDKIRSYFEGEKEKKRITSKESNEALGRISGAIELQEAGKGSDLIIEAIVEDLREKKKLFGELDIICPKDTIFASNTSSLSITDLSMATKRSHKFAGLHFFNPPSKMRLVEVVKACNTSKDTAESLISFVNKIGKYPILLDDSPGFLVNRMLIPMINEAAYVLMEGVARKEEIDASMKLGANHPMGPLELADLIGLDVCLQIMENLYATGDQKHKPCPLFGNMIKAGYLGRKSMKGFYDYRDDKI
jgi:3-hydroxybutyryl-CoA dehydrogenase